MFNSILVHKTSSINECNMEIGANSIKEIEAEALGELVAIEIVAILWLGKLNNKNNITFKANI